MTKKVALIGNPNSGKSTLFNALTGARQQVGNWAGVTVERKLGVYEDKKDTVEITDLPGTYSLVVPEAEVAIDERIARDHVLGGEVDVFVNIIDAANIGRNLYLTLQLLEMGVPLIIVCNRMDIAARRGIKIDTEALAKALQCPVIPVQANRGKGVAALKKHIEAFKPKSLVHMPWLQTLPQSMVSTLQTVFQQCMLHLGETNAKAYASAVRLLEGDQREGFDLSVQVPEAGCQDIAISSARYAYITQLTEQHVCVTEPNKKTLTAYLDTILLNRVLGVPIFFAVMYAMFVFAINVGGAFQDFFDITSSALFVDTVQYGLEYLALPHWVVALVANGLGVGVNTVLTFIPVIGGMFLFLSFLEDSGYMARAAFVMDRFMQTLGLPGKSFVPLIVGFGCNVPAVMGVRALESKRDRILTVMMSPFMSCGARLAIFTVFVSAFFKQGGQNVVFLLYFIGVLAAVFTGYLLKYTILKGAHSPMVLELPPYQIPQLKTLCMHAWHRLRRFIFNAGKLILPVCIFIGGLNAIDMRGNMLAETAQRHSVLSAIGRTVTPVFAPMGLQEDNWPATVGLVTGVLAKEVVVGSLNTLYAQDTADVLSESNDPITHLLEAFKEGINTAIDNLKQLPEAFQNPILASAPDEGMSGSALGAMAKYFDGQQGAFAYLLFILLYFPCVSTVAAMMKEVGAGWASFSVFWSTSMAYVVAVCFYQFATFSAHPQSSLAWEVGGAVYFIAVAIALAVVGRQGKRRIPIQIVS